MSVRALRPPRPQRQEDVAATYADLRAGLDVARLAPLWEAGIPADALRRPDMIVVSHVVFIEGGLFEFAAPGTEGALGAYIALARDADGQPEDLIAWRRGTVARWYGATVLLGDDPAAIGPLPVHPTIVDWLRAGRQGVVVLDRILAPHRLMGRTIAARDRAHADALAAAFTIRPKIVVDRGAYPQEAVMSG